MMRCRLYNRQATCRGRQVVEVGVTTMRGLVRQSVEPAFRRFGHNLQMAVKGRAQPLADEVIHADIRSVARKS
jgi:hypothetical protein